MIYRIYCYYGCLPSDSLADEGPIKLESVEDIWELIPDYFDSYTVMETRDKWKAIEKFARDCNKTKIDPFAYDFENGVDCIGIEHYALQTYTDDDMVEDIIMESDFPNEY